MEARSAFRALGGGDYDPAAKVGLRAEYYTRQRDWYAAFDDPNVTQLWSGPYVFSDGVTLGITPATEGSAPSAEWQQDNQ